MALPSGVIAAIVVVVIIAIMLLLGLIYYYRRKQSEDEVCAKLFQKYTSVKYRATERSSMVAEYPEVTANFVRTPVPGQQFTARELAGTSDEGFIIPTTEAELATKPSMYRALDPEDFDPRKYSENFENEGPLPVSSKKPPQIIFTVDFDDECSILKICVLQAKHLKSSASTIDTYCTVTVKPSNIEKKTKVVRSSLNPNFDETFNFSVPKEEINEKTIEISVFAFEATSRDELIGHVHQKISEIDLQHGKIDLWRRIILARPESSEQHEDYGDLLLRLGYLPSAEKLTVVLLKARNLQKVLDGESTKPPDPYIRVAILHDGNLLKKKKTSTKRKTSNPTYNQAINFAVPLDVLPQIEIQLFIVHDSGVKIQRNSRKETIGYLEISQHAKGDEYDHWVDLLSNKPQARWHRLMKEPRDEIADTSIASEQSLAK